MVGTVAGTPLVGSPIRLGGERADSDRPPPALGEHTGEVLASLGIPPAEAERLRAKGATG
jgi:formyl-CoA transferase